MDPKKPAVAGLALTFAVAVSAAQVADKGAIDFPQAAINALSFVSTDTGTEARQIVQLDAINDNVYVAEPPRKPSLTLRSMDTTARST